MLRRATSRAVSFRWSLIFAVGSLVAPILAAGCGSDDAPAGAAEPAGGAGSGGSPHAGSGGSAGGAAAGTGGSAGREGADASGTGGDQGDEAGAGGAIGDAAHGKSDAGPGQDASEGGNAGSGFGGDAAAPCGVEPVTPNATRQTRNVLCYLHSIYGNHVLAGQEEDNNDNGMNTVYQATGKYPALRSFDVNNSQATSQCLSQWKAGGLCMFGYHMGINGAKYNAPTNIANVLTEGKSENTSFKQDLDRLASDVQPLQDAGGVAILRMFHEAGRGCNWFWWSMGSSAQWQDLYRYAFKYLTGTKGLKSVLWIAPLCGSPDSAHNPGREYIDMGGADTYKSSGDYQPLTSLFQQTESAFPNMMVALHVVRPHPRSRSAQSFGHQMAVLQRLVEPVFYSAVQPGRPPEGGVLE